MNKNEMESWIRELADGWPGHEIHVQEIIKKMVENEVDFEKNTNYYLGYIQGMLVCTEKIKGIMDNMDDSQRALYFSIMKYCSFKYFYDQYQQ